MINRILIRIKAVQLLYSHLLTEKQFSLESQPTPPTKEKRFSYKVYLDTLLLMEAIGRNVTKSKVHPLSDHNPLMKALASDDVLKAHRVKSSTESPNPFIPCIDLLSDKVKNSGVYRHFLKVQSLEPGAEMKVWKEIFELIIWPDTQYNSIASKIQDYSLRGMDRMKEMMETTFVNFMSSNSGTISAVTTLRKSLDKARELYFMLLLLPVAITDLRNEEITFNRNKNLPTEADLNPNMRLADNNLVALLKQNTLIANYCEDHKISLLSQHRDLISHLLTKIMESDIYANYISLPYSDDAQTTLSEDCEFWRNALRDIILPDVDFLETLETLSVFWNDDVDIMSEFAVKTIRRFEEGLGQNAVLPMYKDQEDARFGEELVEAVIHNKAEYQAIINDNLRKEVWETDRLALMDVVILLTAIAEILNFPKIPLRASINEYIEIAKSYSTSKSGQFVNGMLAQIIRTLQSEGKLQKTN